MAKSTKDPTPEHASRTGGTPESAATPAAATSAVAAQPAGSKSTSAVPAKRAAGPPRAAGKPASRAVAKQSSRAVAKPAFRHPNLGLAPVNMRSGFPMAAEKLRRDTAPIAARALEAAVEKDPTIKARYDETGLRRLLRDTVVTERLAMCLGSDDPRWLVEYAYWIAPIYRRRGVSLLDVCALCDGIRGAVSADLGRDERTAAERSLDAAIAILKRNSRLAGDRHKRNALWKWMYRGV